MKVKINNIETATQAATVAELAKEHQLPDKGVAMAVNNNMVARDQWNSHTLKEGDDIVILKAFCGG